MGMTDILAGLKDRVLDAATYELLKRNFELLEDNNNILKDKVSLLQEERRAAPGEPLPLHRVPLGWSQRHPLPRSGRRSALSRRSGG